MLKTGTIYKYNHMTVMFEYMLKNGKAAVHTFDSDGNQVFLSVNPRALYTI